MNERKRYGSIILSVWRGRVRHNRGLPSMAEMLQRRGDSREPNSPI
jgi:hypothetical protein